MTKNYVKNVKKRDGTVTDFNQQLIKKAIKKALEPTEKDKLDAVIKDTLKELLDNGTTNIPHVEQIQNLVEDQLIAHNMPKTAKAYILFRDERNKERLKKEPTAEHRNLVQDNKKYFKYDLRREFVYTRTYANWLPQESRREVWEETVDRSMQYMHNTLKSSLNTKEYNSIRKAVLTQENTFSMRHFQFAGKPMDRTHACAYNCSYTQPYTLYKFGEVMDLLMLGVGVGFSVEQEIISDLPKIKRQKYLDPENYVIEDSREGWVNAVVKGMEKWYNGEDIEFDFSKIRKEGERLKTMGGRASGPRPLQDLLVFIKRTILSNQGRRLKSLHVHDILTKEGEVVIAGGVRRSAELSLSDFDDLDIRLCKSANWYENHFHRRIANNSVAYDPFEKPNSVAFMEEWMSLAKNKTGERGILNRFSFRNTLPQRRLKFLGRKNLYYLGTNPCGEIILQPDQFCNLTGIICRKEDTIDTLLNKARTATILGTYQSTLTNFPNLSPEWKENCESERLLGVSLTGIWDCKTARDPNILRRLKEEILSTNVEYSKKFGINPSNAVTTIKPSGTEGKLVGASNGLHAHYAPYYLNRIQINESDPLLMMLKDQGVPCHRYKGTTWIVEFPVKAPEDTKVFANTLTAIEQLEHWKNIKLNYTEHNPSCTIYVGSNEWLSVGAWVYENWDIVGGLSFFPKEDDEHTYYLQPLERITKDQYLKKRDALKDVDFSKLTYYEQSDETCMLAESACSGPTCSL